MDLRFPWRQAESPGTIVLDSCGIFMIGKNAQCRLVVSSYAGLLAADLPHLRRDAGPGKEFGCYLPKADSAASKLDAAVAADEDVPSDPQLWLKTKEKQCVFTNNPGRRSKGATVKRSKKYWRAIERSWECRPQPAYHPPVAPPQLRPDPPSPDSTEDEGPGFMLLPEGEEELRAGTRSWWNHRQSWAAVVRDDSGGGGGSAVADSSGGSSWQWSGCQGWADWSGWAREQGWTGWQPLTGWQAWTGWLDWSAGRSWSGWHDCGER